MNFLYSIPLDLVLDSFLLFYILWLFFIAVMDLRDAKAAGTLNLFTKCLGYPVLGIGLALDLVANILPASLLFLQLPHELTVSSRLQTLVDGPAGWRRSTALFISIYILNSVTSSPHIKIPTTLLP